MLKKAQVIMLPTEQNPTSLSIGNKSKIAEYHQFLFRKKEGIYNNHTFQHLYIISDDKIKEGDWFYDLETKKVYQQSGALSTRVVMSSHYSHYIDNCKKIIATTDTSLTFVSSLHDINYMKDCKYNLPQPSQQFITKYIEEYNKGNIITDVLVEYGEKSNEDIQKELGIFGHDEGLLESEYNEYIKTNSIDKLKINPKDNTITIKKLKDSWNREEIEQLLHQIVNDSHCLPIKIKVPSSNNCALFSTKWIKDNL